MAESLWESIDDWYATNLMNELGAANPNGYTDLLIKQIETTDSDDALQDNVNYPAIFIRSRTSAPSYGDRSRCGNLISEETTFSYVLLIDTLANNIRTAKTNAQTLHRRIVRFFRKYPCPPISIATGESVSGIELIGAQIYIYEQQGGAAGVHNGRLSFEFQITGTG